jgi:hypothetical protein
MPKSVATAADLQATPASGFTLQAPIVSTPAPKLTIGGKPVVTSATATFVGPNNATVVVQLNGGHKLQGARGGVLTDGDQAIVGGCRLTVRSTSRLRTD